MKYLSVCSGIEAATVAWHPLGWEPVAFSEVDAFPRAVLAHHYPQVPNLGDMTKFKEWPDADVDLLVGGTPCQPFSVAGLRKGLDDPRGSLMLVYLALARRYRPRWLVWENVPGVLSADDGRAFGSLLGGLAELGYGFAYRVLDAQYFGLAQRRKRVFVVGHLGDWRRAAAVLFERESLSGHPAPRREAGQVAPTVPSRRTAGGGLGTDFDWDGDVIAGTLTGGASSGGHGRFSSADAAAQNLLIPSTGDISHCLNAGGMGRQDYETEKLVAHSLRADRFDASEDGTGRGTPLVPVAYGLDEEQNATAELMGCLKARREGGGFEGCVAHAFDARQSDVLQYGNLSGPLDTDGTSIAVAFSVKDHGADAGDIAPTLRAGGHHKSHANGGVMPAVAFREVAGAITQNYGKQPDNSDTGLGPNLVGQSMAVRRLTPRECERLQGFPDDYTLIPYRGKLAADGPRYKALGNSMAVPCMSWLGSRIQMVEDLK